MSLGCGDSSLTGTLQGLWVRLSRVQDLGFGVHRVYRPSRWGFALGFSKVSG